MSTGWHCPVCGCAIQRYDRSKLAFVCGQCGRPVDDPQRDQEQLNYDRTFALARDHLRVGDYEKCVELVTPLRTKRPADPQIYLILLACYTCGYHDLVMADASKRKAAAECYVRLENLRCRNRVVMQYVRRRKEFCAEQAAKAKRKAMCCWGGSAVALLIGFATSHALWIGCALVAGIYLASKGCDCAKQGKKTCGWSGGENPFC